MPIGNLTLGECIIWRRKHRTAIRRVEHELARIAGRPLLAAYAYHLNGELLLARAMLADACHEIERLRMVARASRVAELAAARKAQRNARARAARAAARASRQPVAA